MPQNLKVMRVEFPDGSRNYQINDGDSPLAWIDEDARDGLARKLLDAKYEEIVLVDEEGKPVQS